MKTEYFTSESNLKPSVFCYGLPYLYNNNRTKMIYARSGLIVTLLCFILSFCNAYNLEVVAPVMLPNTFVHVEHKQNLTSYNILFVNETIQGLDSIVIKWTPVQYVVGALWILLGILVPCMIAVLNGTVLFM
jgi:hypothetical protein